MKKYINIKKFKLACAKNVQLATVAVAGLGITLFCSAYSVPEGCTPSVSVNAELNNGDSASCGTALVWASCVGDDPSDMITAYDNGSSGPTIGFNSDSGQACDSTSWGPGDPDFAVTISLVTGVNKITATSSELGMTSPEVEIVSNGAHSPSFTCSLSAGCPSGVVWGDGSNGHPKPPRPSLLKHPLCGAKNPYDFYCLNPSDKYYWQESGANIWVGPYYFSVDSTGHGTVPDTTSTICPSDLIASDTGGSFSETWILYDYTSGTPVPVTGCSGGRSGNSTLTPSKPSISINFTGGDVTGTVGCP